MRTESDRTGIAWDVTAACATKCPLVTFKPANRSKAQVLSSKLEKKPDVARPAQNLDLIAEETQLLRESR